MNPTLRLVAPLGVLLLAPSVAAAAAPLPQGSGGMSHANVQAPPTERITFENLAPGTIAAEVFTESGRGPVLLVGNNPALPGANAAVIFNSAAPTGEDDDLGTPNEDFGGPGIGLGGALGAEFENREAQGRILIVAEDLVDLNGDGLVDDPDDADVRGSMLEIDFVNFGPVIPRSITLIDVEAKEPNAIVSYFGAGGALLGNFTLPSTGDNGLAVTALPPMQGVLRMEVMLDGSGAIDDIEFTPFETGRIGDLVWCDRNNNGTFEVGEPGIPNVVVELRCSGPDAIFGNADDIILTTTTDSEGRYAFTNLAPGRCRVRVDLSSVPSGKIPGPGCPTTLKFNLPIGAVFRDIDFCFIDEPGEIGDLVWCDTNDDGVRDLGEPGIDGVDVMLRCAGPDMQLGTADDFVASTTTAGGGMYLFTDVPPGTCRVTVDPSSAPAGKVPGSNCPLNVPVLLEPGDRFLEADFCFINSGEIGDLVWCDDNNDGVRDLGEAGIPGVTVDLRCAGPDGIIGTADDFIDDTVTDSQGNYLFTGIPAGLCEVTVDTTTVPAGKAPGVCPLEVTVALPAGGSFLDADFCFVVPGQVGDLVWCDIDNDGVRDLGEPGIAGVGVELRCAGPDNIFFTADDDVRNTVTDMDGAYLFTGVLPGRCAATVDVGSAPPDKVIGVCGEKFDFTLAAGEAFLTADFCFRFEFASLGDFVYCDEDNDGFPDIGEPGLGGVRVDLVCAGADGVLGTADDLMDSQSTNAQGAYLFVELPPGPCRATVDASTAPAGKVLGICPPVVETDLAPGEAFLDADFCFVFPPVGSIGDLVWCDSNDDGVRDLGEPGIGGVLVSLRCAGPDGVLGTADDVTDSTTTASDGTYLFTGLAADDCRVNVDPTTAPMGKIPGTNCPLAIDVALGQGEVFLDADFCFIEAPARIGDRVFCDTDNDGMQGLGEPGISGARVDLVCAGPDMVFGTADDIVDTTLTGSGGEYLFEGVPAGECRVSVDPTTVPDKLPGVCPLEVMVTLLPGDEFLDADFCFVEPGEIGDLVWCDIDGDGVRDLLEPGVEGVMVDLQCAGEDQVLGTADDIFDSMVTDAQGAYLFTGLPAGPCEVAINTTTIPTNKEVGVCPPALTVNLMSGESFLDADFCITYGPPESCCENGKPQTLTFLYTGEDCSATVTTQDPDKFNCSGNPGFATTVFVRSSADEDPFETNTEIYFEGTVDLVTEFVISAVNAGETSLNNQTYVHVFDETGTMVLQSVEFHASCSQPLSTGQQYGSLLIVDCTGEDEPIPGDCCANGKPRALTFIYTGDSCSSTSTMQDPDKVNCSGDPMGATTVLIRGSDDEAPNNSNALIWFEGLVDIGAEFTLDALNAGEEKLENATFIHIFDSTGGMLLQTVEFHTSCSQPLFVGNQFGASLLVDCVGENEPIPGNCCENGSPRVLVFTYTGESCAATSESQDPGKTSCSGDPGFAQSVFIRGSDDENPFETGTNLWFEGVVDLGTDFALDATNAGEDKLKSATFIHIFSATGGTLLQTVEFHTSCSQPLFIGNQFGASLLIDCIGENEPGVGGGTDLCEIGKPRILTMAYTGESCAATVTAQDPDKVNCLGDPGFASPVFIRSSDDKDPFKTDTLIWFEGTVALNGMFDIDAGNAGETKLKSATFVHVFDAPGGNLLQTVEFHTSCSQPLRLDDQFGSLLLVGFTPE